eukprot:11418636-Alexandrium_andersonii.AAC.1
MAEAHALTVQAKDDFQRAKNFERMASLHQLQNKEDLAKAEFDKAEAVWKDSQVLTAEALALYDVWEAFLGFKRAGRVRVFQHRLSAALLQLGVFRSAQLPFAPLRASWSEQLQNDFGIAAD